MLWPFQEVQALEEFRDTNPVQPGGSPQDDTPSTQLMDDLSRQTKNHDYSTVGLPQESM